MAADAAFVAPSVTLAASSTRAHVIRHQCSSFRVRKLVDAAPPGRARCRPARHPKLTCSVSSGRDEPPNWKAEANLALGSALTCAVAGLALPFVNSIVSGETIGRFLTHFEMIALTLSFGVLHSGLASLRPRITQIIGERAYRILFALASLPSAVYVIYFFIAHRYDGLQMWTCQGVPGVKELVVLVTALSFYFLYPATFNLLEVAAIKKPGFRIYEDGIMRITRHPQLWGQVLWCASHTLWMGNTMALSASMGLLAHHFFGAWNGDRRLRDRYGEVWEDYAGRTSFLPFHAILDGRQHLQFKEFIKPAYLGVSAFIWVAYHFHPDVLRLVGQFS